MTVTSHDGWIVMLRNWIVRCSASHRVGFSSGARFGVRMKARGRFLLLLLGVPLLLL